MKSLDKICADSNLTNWSNKSFTKLVKEINRKWLQQHKEALLEKYQTDKSKNVSYRINHTNELLEEVENGTVQKKKA